MDTGDTIFLYCSFSIKVVFRRGRSTLFEFPAVRQLEPIFLAGSWPPVLVKCVLEGIGLSGWWRTMEVW